MYFICPNSQNKKLTISQVFQGSNLYTCGSIYFLPIVKGRRHCIKDEVMYPIYFHCHRESKNTPLGAPEQHKYITIVSLYYTSIIL